MGVFFFADLSSASRAASMEAFPCILPDNGEPGTELVSKRGVLGVNLDSEVACLDVAGDVTGLSCR